MCSRARKAKTDLDDASRAVESDRVCASTEAIEDGVAFLFTGGSDVGLIATDRAGEK